MNCNLIRNIIMISAFIFGTFSQSAFATLPVTTDSRIKTLVYTPQEIYQLRFHFNYQSYIEFPEIEEIELVAVGDRYSWDIKKVKNRLFIKPQLAGVKTNMTIMTDQHIYHFEIISSKKSYDEVDDDLVLVAKFYYPEAAYDYMESIRVRKPVEELAKEEEVIQQHNSLKTDKIAEEIKNELQNNNQPLMQNPAIPANLDFTPPAPMAPITTNTPPPALPHSTPAEFASLNGGTELNFNYTMVGDEGEISPIKIFDNGMNTFFEFNGNILPDIYLVDDNGMETVIQYSIEGRLVKLDGIGKQFTIRNNTDLLCIFNENM